MFPATGRLGFIVGYQDVICASAPDIFLLNKKINKTMTVATFVTMNCYWLRYRGLTCITGAGTSKASLTGRCSLGLRIKYALNRFELETNLVQ